MKLLDRRPFVDPRRTFVRKSSRCSRRSIQTRFSWRPGSITPLRDIGQRSPRSAIRYPASF